MPISQKQKSAYGHWRYKITDITPATYTITPADFGSVITNSDGVLTATLPAPQASFRGAWVKFFNLNESITIDVTGGNLLVVHNDATATSIVTTTASHIIGNAYTALCDGSKWLITASPADEGVTQTVT